MRETGGWRADGEFIPPEKIDQKALDAEQVKIIKQAEESKVDQETQERWEKERADLVARLPQHYRQNLDYFLGRQEELRDMYFNIAKRRRG